MRVCTDPRHASHCDADCPACRDECGDEHAVEVPACPVCGSEQSHYLGVLGLLHWFRCVMCGMDHNLKG